MPRRPRRLPRGRRLFVPAARLAPPAPAVRAARRDGARQGEPPEKEVAIVAQEVVNANHPQQQRRVNVASPHARTPALGAALGDQPATSPPSRRPARRGAVSSPPAAPSNSSAAREVRAR